MIVERSPEAKEAFAAGYKQAWEFVIKSLRGGLSVEELETACLAIQGGMHAPLDTESGSRTALRAAQRNPVVKSPFGISG